MEYNKKLVVHTCDSDVKLAICISGAQSFGRFEWAVQPHKGEVASVISYHGFLWVMTFVYSNGPCYLLLIIVGRFYEHAISWQHFDAAYAIESTIHAPDAVHRINCKLQLYFWANTESNVAEIVFPLW